MGKRASNSTGSTSSHSDPHSRELGAGICLLFWKTSKQVVKVYSKTAFFMFFFVVPACYLYSALGSHHLSQGPATWLFLCTSFDNIASTQRASRQVRARFALSGKCVTNNWSWHVAEHSNTINTLFFFPFLFAKLQKSGQRWSARRPGKTDSNFSRLDWTTVWVLLFSQANS